MLPARVPTRRARVKRNRDGMEGPVKSRGSEENGFPKKVKVREAEKTVSRGEECCSEGAWQTGPAL